MAEQEKCRNGHVRTEENTYISPKGARQCKDCPGYKNKMKRYKPRHNAARRRAPGDLGKLNERELARLRSLVGCVVCRRIPGADGWIEHMVGCSVPSNTEGDPKKRGVKPETQKKKIVHIRQCPVCGDNFEAIEYQRRVCKIYCSTACKSQSVRDRRKGVA